MFSENTIQFPTHKKKTAVRRRKRVSQARLRKLNKLKGEK